MALSMYQASVAVYVKLLSGLAGCLRKAAAHYQEKKYDEASLLNDRLYPDMFDFTKQVQSAAEHAKNCAARLADLEAPKFEDNEKSLADLIARVEKTVAFLGTIQPGQIDGSAERTITFKAGGRDVSLSGAAFLLNRSMPNFYFHTSMAYAIMRHNGVEVGKRDFLGPN